MDARARDHGIAGGGCQTCPGTPSSTFFPSFSPSYFCSFSLGSRSRVYYFLFSPISFLFLFFTLLLLWHTCPRFEPRCCSWPQAIIALMKKEVTLCGGGLFRRGRGGEGDKNEIRRERKGEKGMERGAVRREKRARRDAMQDLLSHYDHILNCVFLSFFDF